METPDKLKKLGVRIVDRKKRSDAGNAHPVGERRYAIRNKTTLDLLTLRRGRVYKRPVMTPSGYRVPHSEPASPWYTSPGRALTAFKASKAAIEMDPGDFEMVDDLMRVVRPKKKKRPPIEYGLKLSDGGVFGWYKSANRARQAYSVSGCPGGVPWDGLEVVTRGSLVVEPGMYALRHIHQKHLWLSPKGRTWFKSPRGVELAYMASLDIETQSACGVHGHQNARTGFLAFEMVRGESDGSIIPAHCPPSIRPIDVSAFFEEK